VAHIQSVALVVPVNSKQLPQAFLTCIVPQDKCLAFKVLGSECQLLHVCVRAINCTDETSRVSPSVLGHSLIWFMPMTLPCSPH